MTNGASQSAYNFSRFGANFKLTPAVRWLLIVNVAIYLCELVVARIEGGLEILSFDLAISYDRVFTGEIWQVLTYMFLHDPRGISHILWNMLMLWMFGSPLEQFWGPRRFLKFYFLTGIGAALSILFVAWLVPSQRSVPTLGASGALYALLVAFGFLFPNNLVYLFGLFPIKGKHLVLLFIGIGVLQSLTLSAADVSLAAHFGGMLAGGLLVTGAWKPKKIFGWIKVWWLRQRYHKLKRRIQLVERDPKNKTSYMN
jgi:membrane associated rhomboid family serine protease